MGSTTFNLVKYITVNLDKCIGCRACEVACSGFHATPKYSSINPARSRVRMFVDELNDVYVPVFAGYLSASECSARHVLTIHGKNYSECSFCRSACSSRDLFKEPDSGLPLKCDMCDGEAEPLCVQVCRPGALTYMAEEKEREKEPEAGNVEVGLQALIGRYGLQQVADYVAGKAKKH